MTHEETKPYRSVETTVSPAEGDAAVVALLERKPAVRVPADFAQRVRGALPAARPAVKRRLGLRAVAAAAVVLCAGLFAVAPHAAPSFANTPFDIEMLLLAELGGLACWIAVKRETWV